MAEKRERPRGICPVCERYVGPVDVCPYCDEATARPLSVVLLKFVALFLAVVGLGVLWLAARSREVPLVTIGSISPAMNYGYVRVSGSLAESVSVRKRAGTPYRVSMLLDDGTGTIRAYAYDSRAVELAATMQPPLRKGDRVSVTGSLRVDASDTRRLYVEDAAGFKAEPVLRSPGRAARTNGPAAAADSADARGTNSVE